MSAAEQSARFRRPAVSVAGSWMLASSAVVSSMSLLLPWFDGRIATKYTSFNGYELGIAVFCTLAVTATFAIGAWFSWIRRAIFLVILSLVGAVATVLFSGLTLAISSTVRRVASVVGAQDVVDVNARVGLTVLLLGGLLGVAGALTVLARWAYAGAAEVARDARFRWRRQRNLESDPSDDSRVDVSEGVTPDYLWSRPSWATKDD